MPALRVVQIVVSENLAPHLGQLLEERVGLARWSSAADEGLRFASVVVRAEELEPLLDDLAGRFSHDPQFRTLVLPAQVMLPRPDREEEKEKRAETEGAEQDDEETEKAREASRWRVSREELWTGVAESARVTPVYVAMVVISTIVACIGLMQGSPAVVIGAMVIAPLLGPNLALALSTTLWDRSLLRLALGANAAGAGLAFVLAIAIGAAAVPDPDVPEIAFRTRIGVGDLLLALAAGAAGALSLTTGAPSSLIGVMVAVALMPPLATAGMLLGAGRVDLALSAGLLTAANVIGVNLAAMGVFAVQGVRPRRWWHAERAATAARIAAALWVLLLLAILAGILLGERP